MPTRALPDIAPVEAWSGTRVALSQLQLKYRLQLLQRQ